MALMAKAVVVAAAVAVDAGVIAARRVPRRK
jgi:hypothetical protein